MSPMQDRSFIISAVAATGSVLAAALAAATFANTKAIYGFTEDNAYRGEQAALKLGNQISVEDWKYRKALFNGASCTIDGTARYKVKGPSDLTGEVYGEVHFDHETEQVNGWMINGEGEVEINLYRNSEAACDVKKSSQLEVKKTKLIVLPAVVQGKAE